ncbi:MAG: hypothetical protein ACKOW8_02080, partial [Flavobacteriales bacterium]
VLIGLPASSVNASCDNVPAAAVVTAQDNCSENVSVQYAENIAAGNCAGNYTITRTWTAYDACQNLASFTQTINVSDNTAPVFDAYEVYSSAPCDQLPGGLTATDNCTGATVELMSETLNSGGCAGVLYRVYRATDGCGNQSTAEQFIALQDNVNPTIDSETADFSVECGDDYSVAPATFSDNCDDELDVTPSVSSETDGCTTWVTYTWTAVDHCDNETTSTTVVTIVDTTDPTFSNFPGDLTVNCDDALPALVYPSASDNCDDNVEVSVSVTEAPGTCPQERYITRTFTGVDNCGNDVVAAQMIHVVDVTAPVFGNNTSSYTYECDATVPVIQPSASDNCSENLSYSYADGGNWGNSCESGYTRTWTATDECGNSSTFNQSITIVDTTAPVISAQANIQRPCTDYAGTYASAADNCNDVTITYADEMVSGSCAGSILRTYTATDACGNASTFLQNIGLTDDEAPSISSETADFTVECGDAYSVAPATFSDNCDEELDITSSVSSETDGCTTVVTYSWTATDHCDNSTTSTTVVTIEDTTNPWFTNFPADVTISCEQELPAVQYPTTNDNCTEDMQIYYTDEIIPGACANSYSVARMFRVFDNCGNSALEIQTITVIDQTAPVFGDNASNYTYECNTSIPVIQPSATDNCSENLTYSYADGGNWGNSCESGFTRTWTVTDECGNSSTFVQSITVVDTTAPVINGETSIQRPCGDYSGIYVTAADNCNEVTITYTETEVSGSCAGSLLRSYVATDACGNVSATFLQIIGLVDNVNPAVDGETADFTVECGDEYSVAAPSFSDNCDEDLDITSSESSTSDGCTTWVTYTWTATDHCDNSTTSTTVVTIIDTTNPWFENFPANASVSCDEELPAVVYPSAYDACDNQVDIEYASDIIPGTCANSYTVVRTFRAYDNCGNDVIESQYITVSDETAPVFGDNATEFTYECNTNIAVVTPSASDNCSATSSLQFSYADEEIEITSDSACGQFTTFTIGGWGATPYGNNPGVYLHSNFAGAFPNGLTIGCGDNTFTLPTAQSVTDYLPTGGTPSALPTHSVLSSQLIAATLAVRFDAYDADFSEAAASMGALIVNYPGFEGMTVSELLSIANEVIGGCSNAYSYSELNGVLTALNENYDNGTIDNGNFTCDGGEQFNQCARRYRRTWTVTDECGNSSTFEQLITIVDTTAPVFVGEATVSRPCDDYAGNYVTVSDNCHEFTLSYTEIRGNASCAGSLARRYRAMDECGNVSFFLQTILLTDDVAPVIDSETADFTVECDEQYNVAAPSFSDNCDNDLDITSDMSSSTDGCTTVVTYTWIATDHCDNITTSITVVTIVDTTDPTFDFVPANATYECTEQPLLEMATASDNCDSDVEVSVSTQNVDGSCPSNYQIVRTFTAVDNCGNTATAVQTITVQ